MRTYQIICTDLKGNNAQIIEVEASSEQAAENKFAQRVFGRKIIAITIRTSN